MSGSKDTRGDDRAAAWRAASAQMRAASQGVDWSAVDWSKLTAKDVGVRFGPVMTAEEFAEYRRRAGGDVRVVKADATLKPQGAAPGRGAETAVPSPEVRPTPP